MFHFALFYYNYSSLYRFNIVFIILSIHSPYFTNDINSCYRCFLRSRGAPGRLYFLQHYFLLERRLYLGEYCTARGHHSLLFVLVGSFLLQSESLRLAEKRTSWTVNQTRINVYSSMVCSH